MKIIPFIIVMSLLGLTPVRAAEMAKGKIGKAGAMPRRMVVRLLRDPFKDRKTKVKSHQGALKRFFQSADGTYWHKAAGKRHLNAGSSRRRQMRRKLALRPVEAKGIIRKLRKLLPYGTVIKPPGKYVQPKMWARPEGWAEAVAASKRAPHALPN